MAKVSWDEAEEKAKNVGGGTFLSFKNDKDKAVVVFIGDPDARETTWDTKAKRSLPFTEQHAKEGLTPQLKIKFNVVVLKQGNGDKCIELDRPAMKVLEINAKTFNAVLKAKKKYGLDKYSFEIERSGVANDNKTTYSVLSDEEITDAQKAIIAELKPHDLDKDNEEEDEFDSYDKGKDGAGKDAKGDKGDKKKTDKPAEKPTDKPAAPAADTMVSPEVAQQLVGRLKPLDRELGVNKFLSKFGIAKIKELKQKDYAEADAFITALEKPAEAPAPAVVEDDPFN